MSEVPGKSISVFSRSARGFRVKTLYSCNRNVCIVFTDSEKVYKADMVLLAMGFLGPEKEIIKELSLDEDPRSNIDTPKGNYKTSVPKVYAAGGMKLKNLYFICFVSNRLLYG